MNFSKKDTSQEEETTYNYPAAMSNLHVCACDDLFFLHHDVVFIFLKNFDTLVMMGSSIVVSHV